MGAFLVSAELKNGVLDSINIHSEKGGTLKVKNTFGESYSLLYKGEIVPCINGVWNFEIDEGMSCTVNKCSK